MKSLSLSVLALMLITLVSCTDHEPTDPLDRLRVKSITRILPLDVLSGKKNVSAFNYDSYNRIASIVSYETPDSTAAVIGRTTYEYDRDNRVSIIKRSVNPFGSEEYKYTYDSDDKLIILDYDAGNFDAYHITYKYAGNTLESSLRKFNFNSSISFKSEQSFTFSGQNLSKVDIIQTVEKVIPFVSTNALTFTYDDKINPFYGVYMIPSPFLPAKPTNAAFSYYTYYGGYDNFLTLSPANALSQINSSGDETYYEYQYNEAGFPTMRISKNRRSLVVETLLYEYEKY